MPNGGRLAALAAVWLLAWDGSQGVPAEQPAKTTRRDPALVAAEIDRHTEARLTAAKLQSRLEQHKHFFRDDRHFSQSGKDYIGCLWFETLLKHDGLTTPAWLKDEVHKLESDQ